MTVPCGGPGAPISAINAVCAGTTLHVALVFSAYVPVAVSDIRGALEADDDFASLMELLRAEPLEENINMDHCTCSQREYFCVLLRAFTGEGLGSARDGGTYTASDDDEVHTHDPPTSPVSAMTR